MNEPPFVSVIIPVLNDSARLALCLTALEAQQYAPDRYEVLVIDNGSDVPLESMIAAYPHARLAVEQRRSSYAARNHGIALAAGSIIAFTDSDCIPAADWLARGVEAVTRTPMVGVVAGRVDVFPRDPVHITTVERYEQWMAFPQAQYVETSRFGVTANVFTTRAVIDLAGAFDATFESNGDREWGQRVHTAGYRIVYADSVVVAHPARRTLGDLLRKARRVIRGDHHMQTQRGYPRAKQARDLLREFTPPIRRILTLYQSPQPDGIAAKTGMMLVLLAVRYTRFLERLRLWISDRR